jgi:NADPH:quinone reductase-like Zn-dependent oxidoreductase
LTNGEGVDVVVDFIGAPYMKQNVDSLAVDGRIVLLATLGGSLVEDLDLRAFFRKRATLTASTLRNRDLGYKIRLTRDFASTNMPLFEDATLKAVVDRVYDWSDVAAAHRYMGENRNAGKIVLRVQ